MSLYGVTSSSHKETDTRILVHAVQEGNEVLIVKACDRDVLVIAISVLSSLQSIGLQQLKIAFGQGQHLRWIPIHDLCVSLGPEKSSSTPSLDMMLSHHFTAKERSLHYLECVWWGIKCNHQTKPVPANSRWWWPDDLGEVCGHDVWQVQVLPGVLMMRGWICLLENRNHMKPFLQLKQLYISMWSTLLPRQVIYGASH